MICSDARLNANRQNARKSTGPKTDEGKERSAQNALKHGLCAAGSALLPTEDPDAYAAFTASIIESLRPATAMEEDLALRVADLTWRLRRIPDAEAAILARDVQHRIDHARTQYDRALAQHEDYCRHRPTKKHLPDPPEPPDLTPVPAAHSLAATFCNADHARNPFLTLQRYEQSLDRARSRALKELRQLQKDRRDHPPDEDEHDVEAPRPNEPIPPAQAATPSPSGGEGWGEGERPDDQDACEPRRNEPTAPQQVTSDQGPMTTTGELPNEPTPHPKPLTAPCPASDAQTSLSPHHPPAPQAVFPASATPPTPPAS